MTAEKKAQVRAAIWQPGYAGDEAKSELLGLLDAAEAEIVTLREKLQVAWAAPHAMNCRTRTARMPFSEKARAAFNASCNCWKANL